MGDTAAQANALSTRVGLRRRDDLVVYRLSGDDQRSWLNGQVTHDVRHTVEGDGVYCLAITVKGRIMADIWALDLGPEGLAVAMPKAAADEVIARFDAQIIMEDVELEAAGDIEVFSLQGPRSGAVVDRLSEVAHATGARVVRADELGHGGHLVLAPAAEAARVWNELEALTMAEDGRTIEDEGWELARLRAGRPRFGRDFGPDTYPQEAGLKGRAVSFNKGCYVGQEVVCTLENRGRLSRSLCRLRAAAKIDAGAALRDENGNDVGKVTSSAADGEAFLGLGYVKRAQANAGQVLTSEAGPVTVVDLVDP